MLKYRKSIVILSLLFALLVSCSDIPSEYKGFFRLSPSQQEKVILEYPFEQQIDLMIIGWTIPHPPYMFYRQVAKNGEPIVPLLFHRLSVLKKKFDLQPVALCLFHINDKYFSWKEHQEYIKIFEQTLSRIPDPSVREEVIRMVETGKPYPQK